MKKRKYKCTYTLKKGKFEVHLILSEIKLEEHFTELSIV